MMSYMVLGSYTVLLSTLYAPKAFCSGHTKLVKFIGPKVQMT
jgi:hypothetical protein